jgi:hypothetical protein
MFPSTKRSHLADLSRWSESVFLLLSCTSTPLWTMGGDSEEGKDDGELQVEYLVLYLGIWSFDSIKTVSLACILQREGKPYKVRQYCPSSSQVRLCNVRCMDCEGFFPASGVVKYGKKHKCRPCHASYRYVRDNTSNWENMTNEQRRRAVVANRCENQRGRARKLHASHQVFGVVLLSCTCLGYVGVVATKPHYLYPKLGVPLQGLSDPECF